jgi:hypothetical protein
LCALTSSPLSWRTRMRIILTVAALALSGCDANQGSISRRIAPGPSRTAILTIPSATHRTKLGSVAKSGSTFVTPARSRACSRRAHPFATASQHSASNFVVSKLARAALAPCPPGRARALACPNGWRRGMQSGERRRNRTVADTRELAMPKRPPAERCGRFQLRVYASSRIPKA